MHAQGVLKLLGVMDQQEAIPLILVRLEWVERVAPAVEEGEEVGGEEEAMAEGVVAVDQAISHLLLLLIQI